MIPKGIIVSIQGYHQKTIEELAKNAVNAGCVGLRIDKPIHYRPYDKKVPVIGLNKIKVINPEIEPYITPTLEEIKKVSEWADYVAIDYRLINNNLEIISNYCKEKNIKVIADIGCIEDYENIKKNNYYYTYVTTTFSVFKVLFKPDLKLLNKLIDSGENNIIAEGNYKTRKEVMEVYDIGVNNVCIGAAISNIYKLTRKFTTVGIK